MGVEFIDPGFHFRHVRWEKRHATERRFIQITRCNVQLQCFPLWLVSTGQNKTPLTKTRYISMIGQDTEV